MEQERRAAAATRRSGHAFRARGSDGASSDSRGRRVSGRVPGAAQGTPESMPHRHRSGGNPPDATAGGGRGHHRRRHQRAVRLGRSVLLALIGVVATTAAVVAVSAVTLAGGISVVPGGLDGPAATTQPSTTSDPTIAEPAIPEVSEPLELFRYPLTSPGQARAVALTGLPEVAPEDLAAFQRTETILTGASPSCGLTWQLLAGVGLVTAQQQPTGRATRADADAADRLPVIGPTIQHLDGTPVSDTDAGALDHDKVNDRVVGPLLIAPSRWTTVGVDSDNDGARDPQDIDDAALAVGVLLCSTGNDLTNDPEATAALTTLNADPAFATLALKAKDGYAEASTAGALPASSASVPAPGHPIASAPASPSAAPTGTVGVEVHRQWIHGFIVHTYSPGAVGPGATPTPWPLPSPSPTCTTSPTTDPAADGTQTDAPAPDPSTTDSAIDVTNDCVPDSAQPSDEPTANQLTGTSPPR